MSIKACLPGFNREDASLNLDRAVLTIKTTRQENKENMTSKAFICQKSAA